jgi:hypothetical protein
LLSYLSSLEANYKKKIDFNRDSEGLNYFIKMLGSATLTYARKYQSMPLMETRYKINKSIQIFEDYLIAFLSNTYCMNATELITKRLLKKKHYVYASFLGVLSSFPILKGNVPSQEITKAVMAKVAEIVSIKSLDNINDVFHSHKDAITSLKIQHQAFTSNTFTLHKRSDDIGRSENSMYQLAYFTNQLVSKVTNRERPMFTLYLNDFKKYINGQSRSFDQKIGNDIHINLHDFLVNINEKAVGQIWTAVDLCFLNSFWYLDTDDIKTIGHIKKATDLIFKGCNVYDDISDLEVDLHDKILNSVILLALDKGLCDKGDIYNDSVKLKSKLEREGVIYLTIELGNLMFFKGLEELKKAKDYSSRIDIDALIFSAHILRLFALKKWLMSQNNLLKFLDSYTSRVSDEILEYSEYI